MSDAAYGDLAGAYPEIKHAYGPNVHLLANPYLLSLLARFSSPRTHQPEVTYLVQTIYTHMLAAVLNAEFPTIRARTETRMIEHNPEGVWEGTVLDATTPIAIVNVARAGYLPSQTCFEAANHTLDPKLIRMDHIYMNRKVDAQNHVIGVDISGSKIGGPVDKALVIIPDPMGATGGSIAEAIRIYKEEVQGTPRKYVAMHLIVTPEYLKRLTTDHPDVVIYAARLDRGMSAPDVLATTPGKRWNEERGLNENQYIVPGAGGIGEILNNAFV